MTALSRPGFSGDFGSDRTPLRSSMPLTRYDSPKRRYHLTANKITLTIHYGDRLLPLTITPGYT